MTKKNNKSEQSKLIGEHPSSGIFFDWFECEDTPSTNEKKHRKLTNKGLANGVLVDYLSNWILKHHVSPSRLARIQRKKQILGKHQFKGYMDDTMPFPVKSATTQKGNLGEIILGEYLSASTGLELLVYKLHYNPNVEQSMKGDDILLFEKDDIQSSVIMGEAKFRATKSKQALDDIVSSLSSKNLPISLTFVCDRLEEMGEVYLADEIDKLISNLHKSKTPITYVGFYHSDIKVSETIENHLKSENKNLVVISYGENNPVQLVKDSFDEALKMIMD
ncbi:MAG: SAVED domain-containing protein [Pseudomonadota bacterium]